MKFSLSKPLLSLLAISSGVLAQDKGSIVAPAAGTGIAPNSQFNFSYFGLADYGVSSYAYTVWLLGEGALDKNVTFQDFFTNGWYFGRFDYANYPAIPYQQHPAPAQLTMPDFSQAPGGWGSGKSASNVNFTLVVIEEWADGLGSVGRKFSLTGNPVIYNATSS